MQTTASKKISFSYYVAAVGVVGALAAAVIVMAVIGAGGFGDGARGDAQSVSAPAAIAVSSDALYAAEAAHDMARGWTQVAPVTSDSLFAIEAAQIAQQQAALVERTTVSADAAFSAEAAHDMARGWTHAGAVASADAAYAFESAHDMLRGWGALAVTSDTLYALEAEQMTRQFTAQADALFVTSDDLFAQEAAFDGRQGN